MAWGEMRSPRPPRFPTNRRHGDRSVSTLDPEVRERAKLASLGGHLDDNRRELMQAMRDADDLGKAVVHQQVAGAVTAVDDALATLAKHTEADFDYA